MEKLIFDENKLVGPFPMVVYELEHLGELAFRQNPGLEFTFEGIQFASKLRHLTLENSGVSDLSGVGLVPKLTSLDISEHGDQLVSIIPDELFNLVDLKRLWLDKNGLYGTISTSVGNLVLLEEIDFHKNSLTGTIPTQIGLLTGLNDLSLGDNSLIGTIPTSVENLTSLRGIWAYKNNLSGPLPMFVNMPNLKEIQLHLNAFDGSIPDDFLQQTNTDLSSLLIRIAHNKLTGVVPTALSRFDKMTFHAEDNRFTEIGDLCNKIEWNDGWVE